MKRFSIALVLGAALLCAGVASAYALSHTILLSPGHCKKVHGTKVCAKKVKPRTVTEFQTNTETTTITQTSTETVTVYPSPTGQVFGGNGSSTLAPLTLTQGDEISWTSQGDAYGNFFSVSSSPSDANFVEFDNGSGATSGSTYIPPGSYTFQVTATGPWTISF